MMLRPQKLAKGPLKAFKGKGGKCGIWGGGTFGHLHWQCPQITSNGEIQNLSFSRIAIIDLERSLRCEADVFQTLRSSTAFGNIHQTRYRYSVPS